MSCLFHVMAKVKWADYDPWAATASSKIAALRLDVSRFNLVAASADSAWLDVDMRAPVAARCVKPMEKGGRDE